MNRWALSFVLWVLGGAPARAQEPESPAAERPAATGGEETWTIERALSRMANDAWLHRPPAAMERAIQFSSYDRRSASGPADHDAWYANDDRGKYLRIVEGASGKEHVMAEVDGPGLITRIWSANPSGTLHFDIDGARVWSVDFAALCEGKVEGLGEPLCGMRARGGNCYVPIPFGNKLVVSSTAGDLYYHVDVLQLPAGTPVQSFRAEHLAASKAAFDEAKNALGKPQADGWNAMPGTRSWDVEAGAIVQRISIHVPKAKDGLNLGEQLRRVWILVRCGGKTTVRVPLLDFFAGGSDWRPHGGRHLMIHPSGDATCYFRMPMPRGGSISLVHRGADPSFEPRITGMSMLRGAAQDDDLLFHASFHLRKHSKSRPFSDHLVLDCDGGPGRFVGCSLLVKNPHRAWWGEGDEKFYVDGETFPSTFGTGTEDYFGYAWCDTTVFQSALHGQVQCDGPINFGFTSVHRMHSLDMVPFQRSFRFDLEAWHWVPDIELDYATVAYWYGSFDTQLKLPPLPDKDDLGLDPLPLPKVLRIDGALEAERLAVVSCTGGKVTPQDTWFVEELCSGDQQVWWMDGKDGDELTLAIPVAEAGRYRVKAAFVRAKDYGIVQCAMGGVALGEQLDLYSADIARTGLVELGQVELPSGDAKFSMRITGANKDALPRRMVGLDCVVLEKLP